MLALDELCIRACDHVQEAMRSEKKIRETLIMKNQAASRNPSPNGHPTAGSEQNNLTVHPSDNC